MITAVQNSDSKTHVKPLAAAMLPSAMRMLLPLRKSVIAEISPSIIRQVVKVHDGDGPLWCADDRKVRVAGVQAPDYENTEPCRRGKAGRARANAG
ncbi:hypothetical protein [Sphingomonas radiodurans]|uniref:hypothetical protein n=1 Tax=Sphingomonas radiodurans TaxID=2890321 RepID=UPI001E308664|nr:hypothetical protein [Sphingomonas radiodurans]WBH15302.1 hypothetical protein LLW23_10640 [Sphingomonas radiodurans]